MCVSGWANVQGQINRPRARIGRAIGWQRKYTWRIADNMYNVCDQAIAGKQKNTLKNRDIIYIYIYIQRATERKINRKTTFRKVYDGQKHRS